MDFSLFEYLFWVFTIYGDCKNCVFTFLSYLFLFLVWIVGSINESGIESENSIIQSSTKDPLSCYSHSAPGMLLFPFLIFKDIYFYYMQPCPCPRRGSLFPIDHRPVIGVSFSTICTYIVVFHPNSDILIVGFKHFFLMKQI